MPSSENFIEFHPACQSWKATVSTACAYRSLSTSLIFSLQFHNKELKNLHPVKSPPVDARHVTMHVASQVTSLLKMQTVCFEVSNLKFGSSDGTKCKNTMRKTNELVSTSVCLVRPSWQAIWICRNGCKDQLQSSFAVHFDSASFCGKKEPDIDIYIYIYYIYMIYKSVLERLTPTFTECLVKNYQVHQVLI
jgi:hypothetical protein